MVRASGEMPPLAPEQRREKDPIRAPVLALFLLLVYGVLLLWAGYAVGTGQTQPPALLLKMPVGILIGALSVCGGIFSGVLAARAFSESDAKWRKFLLAALGCLLPGGWVFSVTLF